MHINQRKEQFSRAYIHAVASVAGYALYEPYVDDDSIDCGLAARGAAGIFFSPRVELQLKSSSRNIVKKDRIVFPLGIKNYNDLRVENVLVPRILVVVIVPKDIEYWLSQTEEEMCFNQLLRTLASHNFNCNALDDEIKGLLGDFLKAISEFLLFLAIQILRRVLC